MILALLGVACILLAYICLAAFIRALVEGGQDIHFYMQRGVQIGILWILRYAFHGFSNYSSLGAVQMRSSGEYKNIICDRADQVEPTLAHVVPEFTANIVDAIAMFIYMMYIDWCVGLWQLICIPAGFVAFAIMMSSTPKYYPDTIKKTKALNATAVEYIGGSGGHLSGGERQRISIARAIMKNAPIIILDEATANVDPDNENLLMKAVETLTKEKTVIMIAHRLKTVENADQIFVIDRRKIVPHGKHHELMNADGIYKRFIGERKEAAGWKIGSHSA